MGVKVEGYGGWWNPPILYCGKLVNHSFCFYNYILDDIELKFVFLDLFCNFLSYFSKKSGNDLSLVCFLSPKSMFPMFLCTNYYNPDLRGRTYIMTS